MRATAAPLVRSHLETAPPQSAPRVQPFAPRLGRRTVHRLRLHASLEAGVRRRLTLISAPPGAGKTIALLSWLENRPDRDRVAWLSLNERDDNPLAFWRRLAM